MRSHTRFQYITQHQLGAIVGFVEFACFPSSHLLCIVTVIPWPPQEPTPLKHSAWYCKPLLLVLV